MMLPVAQGFANPISQWMIVAPQHRLRPPDNVT